MAILTIEHPQLDLPAMQVALQAGQSLKTHKDDKDSNFMIQSYEQRVNLQPRPQLRPPEADQRAQLLAVRSRKEFCGIGN